MPRVRAGRKNRLVSLSRAPQTTPDDDGFFEPLSPPTRWAAIEPYESSTSDGTRLIGSRVTMDFHPQVTIDVRLVYTDPMLNRDRELFVKGVQNVNDGNYELILFCEEVTP